MTARLHALASRCLDAVFGRPDLVDITNVIGGERRVGHVKAWGCRGRRYRVGDDAPHLAGRSTYSVATVEGWHVSVVQGKVDSWSKKPIHATVADVYGRFVSGASAHSSASRV